MKKFGRILAISAMAFLAFATLLQIVNFVLEFYLVSYSEEYFYAFGGISIFDLIPVLCYLAELVCLLFLIIIFGKKSAAVPSCIVFAVFLMFVALTRLNPNQPAVFYDTEDSLIMVMSIKNLAVMFSSSMMARGEMLACTACGLSFAAAFFCKQDEKELQLAEEMEELQEITEEPEVEIPQVEAVTALPEDHKPIQVKVVKKTKA